MWLRFFIFLLTIFISANAFAQENSFKNIDEYMAKIPAESTGSIKSIVNYILAKKTSETEKVRAVFDFVASNIGYDMNAADIVIKSNYSAPNIVAAQIPEAVLKNKLAICQGYAALFQAICDSLRIPCFSVMGLAYQSDNSPVFNHAWNVVQLNNQWKFIDATWGAGGVDPTSKAYKKSFNPEYFFASPEEMIQRHYPIFPYWQLSNHLVTFEDFLNKKSFTENADSIDFRDSLKIFLRMDSIQQLYYLAQTVDDFNKKNNAVVSTLNMRFYKAHLYNHYNRLFNKSVLARNESIQVINKNIAGKPLQLVDKQKVSPYMKKLLQDDNTSIELLKKSFPILPEKKEQLKRLEKNAIDNLNWLKNLANKLHIVLE